MTFFSEFGKWPAIAVLGVLAVVPILVFLVIVAVAVLCNRPAPAKRLERLIQASATLIGRGARESPASGAGP